MPCTRRPLRVSPGAGRVAPMTGYARMRATASSPAAASRAEARSAHREYRDGLDLLSAEGTTLAAISSSAGCPAWFDPDLGWRRTHGRFQPHKRAYARLVLERARDPQEIVCLEVSTSRWEDERDGQALLRGAGWARFSRIDDDPGLTTLATLRPRLPSHRVVRYRPGDRCTIHVGDEPDSVWVKVFRDRRGGWMHAHQETLWGERCRGALAFAVAQPGWFDEELRALWLGHVVGEPVRRLLGPRGPALGLAHRMGRALASLGASAVRPHHTLGAADLLVQSEGIAAEIRSRVPSLAGELDRLVERLRALHRAAEGRPHRPIHGAPRPDQWLDAGETLGLVDFDGLALGDPELDVATFQAAIDFEAGPRRSRAAVAAAFVAGYESVAGPLDRALLIAYRAHRRLDEARRSVREIRSDGDRRTGYDLARAMDTFDDPLVAGAVD